MSPLSVCLATINCRHSHAAPAIRILRQIALDLGHRAECEEFLLNDPVWKIADTILAREPDLVGLSVYLWNREKLFDVARLLKAARPECRVILGGPEVSHGECPDRDPWTHDAVIHGEGEKAWAALLGARDYEAKPIWPYRDEELPALASRMVYLETARGCPHRCAFCQGGENGKPREWLAAGSIEATAVKIRQLTAHGVRTIKFLDRTFNADPSRALQWFRALAEIKDAAFHFEIRAELLDDETLDFLGGVNPGHFQFEIGIQSLHPPTLRAIGRPEHTDGLLTAFARLLALRTVHVHADLIWGLPEEGLQHAVDGFNRVAPLGLDELQLGFLKLLPGTRLEASRERWGYRSNPHPPYEFLSHQQLSGGELLRLKRVANSFDLFFNSRRFRHTITHLFEVLRPEPFAFYERLATRLAGEDALRRALSLDETYRLLYEEFKGASERLLDHLRLDYVTAQRANHLPSWMAVPGIRGVGLHDGFFHVPFQHAFDPARLLFSESRAAALYRVKWRDDGPSYFRSVGIERL